MYLETKWLRFQNKKSKHCNNYWLVFWGFKVTDFETPKPVMRLPRSYKGAHPSGGGGCGRFPQPSSPTLRTLSNSSSQFVFPVWNLTSCRFPVDPPPGDMCRPRWTKGSFQVTEINRFLTFYVFLDPWYWSSHTTWQINLLTRGRFTINLIRVRFWGPFPTPGRVSAMSSQFDDNPKHVAERSSSKLSIVSNKLHFLFYR